MWVRRTFVTAIIGVALAKSQPPYQAPEADEKMLFDFTNLENVDNWTEVSDTLREVGMSKAAMTLQTTQLFQRAVFFTLLNPQPNGAGFAGVRAATDLDLSRYGSIDILCRAQGANKNYKMVLRHRGMRADSEITYDQFFSVSTTDEDFGKVSLSLDGFKPYFRGRELPDEDPLDTGNITSFGLQVYGGVYMPVKQKGVSALEIQTICASP